MLGTWTNQEYFQTQAILVSKTNNSIECSSINQLYTKYQVKSAPNLEEVSCHQMVWHQFHRWMSRVHLGDFSPTHPCKITKFQLIHSSTSRLSKRWTLSPSRRPSTAVRVLLKSSLILIQIFQLTIFQDSLWRLLLMERLYPVYIINMNSSPFNTKLVHSQSFQKAYVIQSIK